MATETVGERSRTLNSKSLKTLIGVETVVWQGCEDRLGAEACRGASETPVFGVSIFLYGSSASGSIVSWIA